MHNEHSCSVLSSWLCALVGVSAAGLACQHIGAKPMLVLWLGVLMVSLRSGEGGAGSPSLFGSCLIRKLLDWGGEGRFSTGHVPFLLTEWILLYICSLLLDEHLYYANPYERRGVLDGGLRRLDVNRFTGRSTGK